MSVMCAHPGCTRTILTSGVRRTKGDPVGYKCEDHAKPKKVQVCTCGGEPMPDRGGEPRCLACGKLAK